ncbi:MAG: diaminopimelate epimerase, partial [Gemmatimonadota bacterium]
MNGTRFTKGHALGNDYIVIDRADLTDDLSPAQAVKLCDRHLGAGSDGVLLADLANSPVSLRIINPDGTEAEKSGNGLRILGAYLHHRGAVATGEWFDVRLIGDVVEMRVEQSDRGVVIVRVRMGSARFDGEPGRLLDLGEGLAAHVDTLSVGNPHCVVFVPELERADFLMRAPRLCTHDAFARGTNVQFARATGTQQIEA